MAKEMTILVSSCDAYEDCWLPFMALLRKYWPDCAYDAVLCTQSKECDAFTRVMHMDERAWSKRLRLACQGIQTPYLLFMLEDFWIGSPVEGAAVDRLLERMQGEPDIGVIYLDERMDFGFPASDPDCLEIPVGTPYRINTGIAIWRREFLLSVLDDSESAWEFERVGSFREAGQKKRSLRTKRSVITRFSPCGAITRGQWVRAVRPFVAKESLVVDLSKRKIEGLWPVMRRRLRSVVYGINPKLIVKIQNALYYRKKKRQGAPEAGGQE